MKKASGLFACGALFIGCAALGFVLTVPAAASSASRFVAGKGCVSEDDATSRKYYYCGLGTDTDAYKISALSGAWFDFKCLGNTAVSWSLSKTSWTGSVYMDITYYICTDTGNRFKLQNAVNVKTTPNGYLTGMIAGAHPLYGIEAVFTD